jgi:hypothetical protein
MACRRATLALRDPLRRDDESLATLSHAVPTGTPITTIDRFRQRRLHSAARTISARSAPAFRRDQSRYRASAIFARRDATTSLISAAIEARGVARLFPPVRIGSEYCRRRAQQDAHASVAPDEADLFLCQSAVPFDASCATRNAGSPSTS